MLELLIKDGSVDLEGLNPSRDAEQVLARGRGRDVGELLHGERRHPRLEVSLGVGRVREITKGVRVSLEAVERRRVLLTQLLDGSLEPHERLLHPGLATRGELGKRLLREQASVLWAARCLAGPAP